MCVTLCLKYFVILLIIFPHVNVANKAHGDCRETSNLPFRYELEQVTMDFKEKLRKELSKLEMEMYIDFLQFLQEIDSNQTTVTNELTKELGKQMSTILEKFTKVMVYSSERIDSLKEKMNDLSMSLGSWVKDTFSDFDNFHLAQYLHKEFSDTQEIIIGRTKRHTGHFGAHTAVLSIQEISEAKKMLEMDPEDFPIQEGDDIFSSLDPSQRINDEKDESDVDHTFRDVSPRSSRRYVVSKRHEGKKAPPRSDVLPRNCYDLLQRGNTQNGVYVIYPSGKGEGIEVWCDQTTAGGGWTVLIDLRIEGSSVNFTCTPIQYTHGFGTPFSNHWIGLEIMHNLTQGISNTLRVEMKDGNQTDFFAMYNTFRVGSSKEEYALAVADFDLTSTASDSLSPYSGRAFSYPLPADGTRGCSQYYGIGWWFLEEPQCVQTPLIGQLDLPESLESEIWPGIGSDFQSLQFMIRPSAVLT